MATYFPVYGLYQWFLFRRRYVLFALALAASAVFFILAQRAIVYFLTRPIFLPDIKPRYTFIQISWFSAFTNIYLVVAVVSVIKLFKISLQQQE